MEQGAQSPAGPLVTVWTPCYNHEQYLDDYFQGLLAQTYSNIQLILIDDGSTDNSWAKICSYEAQLRAKFPLVVLERHENIGPTEEFLAHFWTHAAGEYMCMLESDDYYLPTRIEETVRYFQTHPDVGAVHSEVDYLYNDRIEYRHWETAGVQIPEGDIYEALLLGNFIMTCTFCCRMDLLRQYVDWRAYLTKGYRMLDYACYLDLARHTRFGYINKSLARYRILQNSWVHTTNLHRRFQNLKNYYQTALDYIQQYGAPDHIRHAALQKVHTVNSEYGYHFYQQEQFREGYNWLAQHNPRQLQTARWRVRALAMRSKHLWRPVHAVETRIIGPAYRALKRWFGLAARD